MRHYEIVLLVHPSRSEQVPAMLHRYKDMVRSAKGRVHRVEDWGRRRLAYMISEVHKAHYVMLNVECGIDTLRELERNFKFNDSVVRSMVVRRERIETGQSAMALAKAEEDRQDAEKQARAERDAAKPRDYGAKTAAAGAAARSSDSAAKSPPNASPGTAPGAQPAGGGGSGGTAAVATGNADAVGAADAADSGAGAGDSGGTAEGSGGTAAVATDAAGVAVSTGAAGAADAADAAVSTGATDATSATDAANAGDNAGADAAATTTATEVAQPEKS